MREKYGEDFYLGDRPRKHRYVYMCGNKKQREAMILALKYSIHENPKGESQRYDASASIETQMTLLV